MKWERLLEQLERILNIPLNLIRMPVEEWTARFGGPHLPESSHEKDGSVYFFLDRDDQEVTALTISGRLLTPAERALIGMNIDLMRQLDLGDLTPAGEEEERALELSRWLTRELELGHWKAALPDQFSDCPPLQTPQIPILLNSDFPGSGKVSYTESKRLLESFFEKEIQLVPLMDREWLILSPEEILNAGSQGDKNGDESLEDSLASLGSGLYEMITTEWFGECHLSVNYPVVPAKSLVESVQQMREAIQLGRLYRRSENVHLPWTLHLERLLDWIPPQEKIRFLERILKRTDHFFDQEMLTTLEHFFALGCNVSETAKKMYIHRNTLLYRLDKFKQETGLDVRNFDDAVLVKIALLLYKVTKRP